MKENMFCFQCEQTAGCSSCTGMAGVCGKKAGTAGLQDELTGALIGLARAAGSSSAAGDRTWRLIIEGLFTTVTNVSFDDKTIMDMTERVRGEKIRLSDGFAENDYDMSELWNKRRIQ